MSIYNFYKIKEFARDGQKIALIKELRNISGCGLKESKDLIEECIFGKNSNGYGTYDIAKLQNLFEQYVIVATPLTKEEFMNIIEEAIDNMGTFYYKDMLNAVQCLLSNIQTNGGLKALAMERDEFLGGV